MLEVFCTIRTRLHLNLNLFTTKLFYLWTPIRGLLISFLLCCTNKFGLTVWYSLSVTSVWRQSLLSNGWLLCEGKACFPMADSCVKAKLAFQYGRLCSWERLIFSFPFFWFFFCFCFDMLTTDQTLWWFQRTKALMSLPEKSTCPRLLLLAMKCTQR